MSSQVERKERSHIEVVESLKKKIELIISKYEQAAADNREFERKLNSLQEQLEIEKQKTKELKDKLDILELTEAFKTSTDEGEAKDRVKSIIKEIDKCITLLSE